MIGRTRPVPLMNLFPAHLSTIIFGLFHKLDDDNCRGGERKRKKGNQLKKEGKGHQAEKEERKRAGKFMVLTLGSRQKKKKNSFFFFFSLFLLRLLLGPSLSSPFCFGHSSLILLPKWIRQKQSILQSSVSKIENNIKRTQTVPLKTHSI